MRRLVLVAAALALGACAGRQGLYTEAISDWRGQLEATAPEGIRAAASARTGFGQTGVSVSVAGAPAGAHPWHVHVGTCGSGGGIFGPATAYPVLNVGAGGTASATANLEMELDPAQSYYVNIHESPTNLGTIIGCFPLSR